MNRKESLAMLDFLDAPDAERSIAATEAITVFGFRPGGCGFHYSIFIAILSKHAPKIP
jgi:hypothetical protein